MFLDSEKPFLSVIQLCLFFNLFHSVSKHCSNSSASEANQNTVSFKQKFLLYLLNHQRLKKNQPMSKQMVVKRYICSNRSVLENAWKYPKLKFSLFTCTIYSSAVLLLVLMHQEDSNVDLSLAFLVENLCMMTQKHYIFC